MHVLSLVLKVALQAVIVLAVPGGAIGVFAYHWRRRQKRLQEQTPPAAPPDTTSSPRS